MRIVPVSRQVAAALAVARPIAYRDSIPLSVKRTRVESRKPHKMTLKTKLALRILVAAAAFAAVMFIPAGSLRFWQGWVYLTIWIVPVLVFFLYFYKHDPELVERRLRWREKVREQKILMRLFRVTVVALFLLPGLDHRFGWSHLPVWLTILSQAFVLGGWAMVFWVMKVNHFAASTIEVEAGQHVVSTGPYSIVRHPMYLGYWGHVLVLDLGARLLPGPACFWSRHSHPRFPPPQRGEGSPPRATGLPRVLPPHSFPARSLPLVGRGLGLPLTLATQFTLISRQS